jgi:hypothetical protein
VTGEAPRPLYTGKLSDALRRFALGEADPFEEPVAPADRHDEEAARFLGEMLEVLRARGGAAAARDREGSLLVVCDPPGGPLTVRARETEIVGAFRAPRPIAALGEDGLRDAVREVLRLESDMPGEGLALDYAKYDRHAVYATYSVTPVGGLGQAVKRIVAWCDGSLVLIQLRRRKERS